MAISNIYLENKTNDRWIKIYNSIIAPLWSGIKNWFGICCITVGLLYANVLFNTQHDVFPLYVAIPIAVGVAWTYISGLAFASATVSRWSTPMIVSGALTDALFGMLYVAGRYKVIAERPTFEVQIALVLAHILPLIALVVIYTYCKRAYLTTLAADQKIEYDRLQRKIDVQEDYERRVREAKLRVALRQEELRLAKLDGETVKSKDVLSCPHCNARLNKGQWLNMKKLNYCQFCPRERTTEGL